MRLASVLKLRHPEQSLIGPHIQPVRATLWTYVWLLLESSLLRMDYGHELYFRLKQGLYIEATC